MRLWLHRLLCRLVYHDYRIAVDETQRIFWRCRYCGKEAGK